MNYKFVFVLALVFSLNFLGCNPNNLGKTSVDGDVVPSQIIDDVINVARKKHPQSVLIAIKTADTGIKYLEVKINRAINASYKQPQDKYGMWDFYFAQAPESFVKEEQNFNDGPTYKIAANQHFGIRYDKGSLIYLAPESFEHESSGVGQNTSLDLTGVLDVKKITLRAQEELQKDYGENQIESIAYALKAEGYGVPFTASWMDQSPKSGRIWSVAPILKGGQKGAEYHFDAVTGELTEKPEIFNINKY